MLFISRNLSFMLMYAFILFKPYAYLILLLIIQFQKSFYSELWRYSNGFLATSDATEKCACDLPFITFLILEKSFLKKIWIEFLALVKYHIYCCLCCPLLEILWVRYWIWSCYFLCLFTYFFYLCFMLKDYLRNPLVMTTPFSMSIETFIPVLCDFNILKYIKQYYFISYFTSSEVVDMFFHFCTFS